MMAITMTSADLCSAAKPWNIQEKSSAIIYQEFYEQVILSLYASCFSLTRNLRALIYARIDHQGVVKEKDTPEVRTKNALKCIFYHGL